MKANKTIDVVRRNPAWLIYITAFLLLTAAIITFQPQQLTPTDHRTLILIPSLLLTFGGSFIIIHRYLLLPLKHILQLVQHMLQIFAQESPRTSTSILNVRTIAGDVARFASLAQEYYRKHQEVSYALEESRQVLAQITLHQQTVLTTTNREIIEQYQSVLSYANYLEGQIQQNAADPSLRYDFDDVCESSFNLKLIAGALTAMRNPDPPPIQPVFLSQLMQQTMLALAPSLDRRAMKLTTAEVDESIAVESDPAIIAQVLWMMLLGTIRYAADESTLRMRCFNNRDATHAIMSIVVSELSPGKLSPEERGAHLARQLQHLTPHMFAETIRIHANIQLAELLLKRLEASIGILPLTSHACEICLTLPIMK